MIKATQDNRVCLIVEDNFFDQEKIRRILERSFGNIKIVVASNLADARDLVKQHKIALILLDNNLPDGKGANYALELHDNPRLAHVPIVMISDWPSPFMFDKAQSAGVIHIVNKSDFGARHIHSAFAHMADRQAGVTGPQPAQIYSA